MVTLSTDRRAIEAVADPEEEALFARDVALLRELCLRIAKRMHRLGEKGTYHLAGCSSIVHYAVQRGVPSGLARTLADLGRALAAPAETGEDAEARIRGGALSLENASWVGRLLERPGNLRPGEDWFGRAELLRTAELRHAVRRRLEEIAQGSCPLVSMTLHVTEAAREDFRRARVLVCREAARTLTEGQSFTRIVRFYLEENDASREGTRRVGPTGLDPQSRYIPLEVKREILARAGGDRCEVPGCTYELFLQYAHIRPHREGSGREARDLLRLCSDHHTQFDADWLFLAGWRPERGTERPVFVTARGEELGAGTKLDPRGLQASVQDDRARIARRRSYGEQVSERPPPGWKWSA